MIPFSIKIKTLGIIAGIIMSSSGYTDQMDSLK
jgi:hypothetical protein